MLSAIVSEHALPTELEEFIARYIRSVEQVEILCLLDSEPLRVWTVLEIFRVVQSSETSVAACLRAYAEVGLVVSAGEKAYRLADQHGQLSALVSKLAKAYRERRVTVVEAIYKKPADTVQDFADAFKLRKDKEK